MKKSTDAERWLTEAQWASTREPLTSARTLPAAPYIEQGFFDLEQKQVFERGWVAVSVADQIVGGRLSVRNVGATSILLTRDDQNLPVGFLNSCRHRGTELAKADCSVANTIRCPYHRWGYNLRGDLVSTPLFEELPIPGFERTDYGLHKVRVEQWGVLIFACLNPKTAPLADWLGDLEHRTRSYGLERWRSIDTTEIRIDANWKLISENYQEYYHLGWVHPELAKISKVNDHYRFQGPGMYCGQTTTPVSQDHRDDWLAMPPAEGLGESDAASGRFLAIFPNVLLSLLPNHAFVILLNPVSPGQTVESCTILLPPSNRTDQSDAFDKTKAFWFEVNSEDIDIVEAGQRGLERGGFTPGPLSPRFEEPLHLFHNMLADQFLGLDRIPQGDPNDHDARLGTRANPLPYLSKS